MSSLDTRNPNHHLDDEQLLRYADGELTPREAEPVERHLAACWQCRTQLDELTQTIGNCVRYRKTIFDDCFPSPPAPWCDIRSRMAEADGTLGSSSFVSRLWSGMKQFAATPRQWAPAMAALVLAAFVINEFRDTPTVSAAVLLDRAVSAAASQPVAKQRKVRMRMGNRSITRISGQGYAPVTQADWESASALQALFVKANYSWDNPLSATSYHAWRNQLAVKEDSVTQPDNGSYVIRTVAGSGELSSASIELDAADWHAARGTLEFRSSETVELTDLGEAAPAGTAAITKTSPLTPYTPQATQAPAAGLAPATLPEAAAELRIVASLSRMGADLGEPIEISRKDGHLLVTGIGIAPQRQIQIQQELASQPGVVVQFSEPGTGAAGLADSPAVSPQAPSAEARAWQTQIANYLGGRNNFDQFSDQNLLLMDAAMSRVHALRRLAERFPAARETGLSADDRKTLSGLRATHAAALLEKLDVLDQHMTQLLTGLSIPAEAPAAVQVLSEWQAASQDIFFHARTLEKNMGILLGSAAGEATSPAQIHFLLRQLRTKLSAYETAANTAQ
ncbi:MAG: zf-HC2 domain-containing protein [Bryobacterales bacterium]|nr:zf-HC2 domain-containing protein [Bryobacterales bacterium]